MAEVKKRKRVQLSADEKQSFVAKLATDSSDENILSLVDAWNAKNKERRIDVHHLRRLRSSLPKFSAAADFYASVSARVRAELAKPGAKKDYEPRLNGDDHIADRKTKRIDPSKVPDVDEQTLESVRFPFNRAAHTPSDANGLKQMRHDFREHFNAKGLVLGRFEDFVNAADRLELDQKHGGTPGAWTPSEDERNPWKIVGDAILTNKRILNAVKQTAAFSEPEKKEDRINPKHGVLKELFLKYGNADDQTALSAVLEISEYVYRGVAGLLPTDSRKNSRRRMYAINPEMHHSHLSFLSCLSALTKVQREHMDDHARGVAGLFGLVDEAQYLIFWRHSYEMNLELEMIFEYRSSVLEEVG